MNPSPARPARTPLVATLAVVGVGLIGGSLALALRGAGAVGSVIGVGRSRHNLEVARARGIVDFAFTIDEAWLDTVASADVVLLATPVAQMPGLLSALAPRLRAGAIVTDAGSTKGDVVAAARAALGQRFAQFVPAHPIAGTEHSGASAAFPELFAQRNVVVCPEPETDPAATARIVDMWEATGARVERLAAGDHDRLLAAVSHLPHMLAFALVADLSRRPDAELFFRYAAGGFRDFTRIASSHPEMWRDIALANRQALIGELDRYVAALANLRSALAAADGEALERVFGAARAARNDWLAHPQRGA